MTVTAEICPQCGAPLNVINGRCAYCETPLRLSGPVPAGMGAPIPTTPAGDPGAPFSMTVDDVFSIKGKGTVATGKIAAGTIKKGDTVSVTGAKKPRTARVTAIEMFRKEMDAAVAGNNVGLVLDGLEADDLPKGATITVA